MGSQSEWDNVDKRGRKTEVETEIGTGCLKMSGNGSNYSRTKAKHKGRNHGDPRAADLSGYRKSWSKTEALFEKWCETSE